MKVKKITDLQAIINEDKTSLVAIWGFFDGWHQGHQALLAELKIIAKKLGYKTLVISFNVKPQAILSQQEISILFDNKTKQEYLVKNEIDNYWELQFNQQLANNSEDRFIEWLINNHVKAVVVGSNIRFGYKGLGNINTLKKSGLQVFIYETLIQDNHHKISSSYIKKLLVDKKIVTANNCLNNFPYSISGRVVDGIKEARKLGFPTANLALVENYTIPGTGIYLTLTKVDNKWHKSLTVISLRDNGTLVESYILDFNQDIYGRIIEVRFLDFLRDNIVYTTKAALISQIEDDVAKAQTYFKTHKI